ncbi:MAG: Malate-2H(+)/Na(+)-lactate antiporter [Calditrichaeota bacterium]|nr:Malate-2H(+)/Na(+)-lactate antiporter [Calditrichota bacterium]
MSSIRPRVRRFLLAGITLFSVPLVLHAAGVGAGAGADAPSWVSLLPPLLAIGLAIVLREVIGSLLLGVLVGSFLIHPADPFAALVAVPGDFFLNALADGSHAAIVLFSLMLGAMVGVLAKSGGMAGIVRALKAMSSSRRGGMLMTWLIGLIIFFDDYANTLLVGNTMRPYTDRLRISRAKLAYLVDSTSAPITSIAVISTWVGFEIGLIQEAARGLDGLSDAYLVFLQSIPYTAYSIFALVFVGAIAWWQRDFGPMTAVERSARSGRDPSRQDSDASMEPAEAGRHAILLALVPVGLVIVSVFAGLYLSGASEAREGAALFEILGAADSSLVLLVASFFGMVSAALLAATVGRINVADVSNSLIDGIKAMMPAMVILLLAWSLGDACSRLGTARFVIEAVSGGLAPSMIPMVVFLVAGVIAFSTGTSWGVMAILTPIAVPLAWEIPRAAGMFGATADAILFATVGAVLAGATFGDHCSPISDTTILSSMASGCNHIDHVRTQIPYALLVAAASILFGYLPSGFGVTPWLGLAAGGALLVMLPRWIGSRPDGPG